MTSPSGAVWKDICHVLGAPDVGGRQDGGHDDHGDDDDRDAQPAAHEIDLAGVDVVQRQHVVDESLVVLRHRHSEDQSVDAGTLTAVGVEEGPEAQVVATSIADA